MTYGRMRERKLITVGVKLMSKKKAFSKKEKIVGAIASAAIMAVPFMVAPVQQGYATSSSPPTAVEKITTIVIPLNETKYIDLDSLYSADYMNVGQNETELNIAEGKFILGNDGIYEITASSIGTATFTVTGTRYEPNYMRITDTFQVIVVPNTENADQYKFDISKVVKLMNESPAALFDTADEVKGLLINVDPETLVNVNPFNSVGNQSPIKRSDAPAFFETVVGMEIDLQYTDMNMENSYVDVRDYFEDPDWNNSNWNPEEPKYLKSFFLPITDNKVELINHEGYGGQTLKIKEAGTVSLPVLVFDNHGGITLSNIDIVIHDTETYILDDDSTVTVDLKEHFIGSKFENVTHYTFEDWSIQPEYPAYEYPAPDLDQNDETLAYLTPYEGVYKVSAMFDANPIESFFVRIKNENVLEDRNLLADSKLTLNLPNLFPHNAGSSVTYSVYLNNESVTGLTYGINSASLLYFEANESADTYSPLNLTITATDAANHITIKDNMLLSALPMELANNGNGFEVTQLFTNLVEWGELDVSSPFIKYEIATGSYTTMRTVHSPNGGNGTTVVTLNYRDEIIYKIPFTYPID